MPFFYFDLAASAYTTVTVLSVVVVAGYVSSWVAFFSLPPSVALPAVVTESVPGRMIAYVQAWVTGNHGLLRGYDEHSKHGSPFIIPNPGLSPDIMLPKEHQKWLVSQPENVLSQRIANVESYALNHLFPSVDMMNEVMVNVVKRYMSGRIGVAQADMFNQLRDVVDARLGTDGGWKQVNLVSFVKDVVVRTGYRVHVGAELCQNEAFIKASWGMTFWTGIGTMIIGQFSPPLLKWPLGLLFSLPITYNLRTYRKIIYPVFKDRLAKITRKGADPTFVYEPPQDAMTWTAQLLLEKNPDGDTLDSIIDNFMTLFTAAFATIPVTVHVMINLLGLAEAQAFLPILREEIKATFSDSENWQDPSATAPGRMPLLEAFLRESMRHTPFFTRGQEHKVLATEGIELLNGTRVPMGTFLACPVAGITSDERFYPEPHVFDPFRFLDEIPAAEGVTGKSYTLKPNCQLTSPSDTFLGFGYGRRACPGRFFAARIMKLLLSYVILHYEFEMLSSRPGNFIIGSFTIPPPLTKARFRRREKTTEV